MVFCFCTSRIWLFFLLMNFMEAVGSGIAFLIVMRQMGFYCERINLRFYWEDQEAWDSTRESEQGVGDEVNPTDALDAAQAAAAAGKGGAIEPQFKQKKLKFPFSFRFGSRPSTAVAEANAEAAAARANQEAARTSHRGFFKYIFRTPEQVEKDSATTSTAGGGGAGIDNGNDGGMSDMNKTTAIFDSRQHEAFQRTGEGWKAGIAMEGYFTTRGRSELQQVAALAAIAAAAGDSAKWERRYFVLLKTGEFYIYKTRQDFRVKPKAPIYLRPLQLLDFYVNIDNSDEILRAEVDNDSKSVHSAALTARTFLGPAEAEQVLRFQITLIPRENEDFDQGTQKFRNHWLLRCDSEEELEIWLGALREVCPSCFKS